MFSKISRKIKLNIIIFLIFFVIIESCVVTYSINHITYRNFVTYAAESVDLSIRNCTFYIDLAMNAADNITTKMINTCAHYNVPLERLDL
jgi:hypothetical protein